MKKILIILCFLPILAFSQDDKRLALVIGNSNYEKSPLNNPVNDALLMAQTLESLDFDVILDTNISNKISFIKTIREFGIKRPDYSVALVYYAGHGIQVGAENYLLPTKEVFETEDDVYYNGVNVQEIMRFLKGVTDNVNILILDACRDNPFEKKWNQSRSIKGAGLAKIPPPTGSLIAFSTDAGNTAADGDGENSIYCESLCKNMVLDNTSLDQVFRNVRTDVLNLTRGNQRPVEASQLTGEALYLVKSTFENEFNMIDSLIMYDYDEYENNENDNLKALEIVSTILSSDSKNRLALIKKGEIYKLLKNYDNSIKILTQAISLYPNGPECYLNRGITYYASDDFSNSLLDYNSALKIDSTYRPAYSRRADVYLELNEFDKALDDYTVAIRLDENNSIRYSDRADYFEYIKDYDNALLDFSKCLELEPENPTYYINRAGVYSVINKYDLALADYEKVFELTVDIYNKSRAINNRAILYRNQGDYELAISEYTRAIEINTKEPLFFSNRAFINYYYLNNQEKALSDYNIAVALAKENDLNHINYTNNLSYYLMKRADYFEYIKDYDNAILDNTKIIELNSENVRYYFDRADVYISIKKYDLALADFEKAFERSVRIYDKTRAINNRAIVYSLQGNHELAAAEYTRAIEIEPKEPLFYSNRAILNAFSLDNNEKALSDYNISVATAKDNDLNHINYSNNLSYYLTKRAYYFKYIENYDNAILDYTAMIDLELENANYYLDRANVYEKIKKYDLALADYEKAFELSLDNHGKTTVLNNRAILYSDQGNHELAAAEYTRAIEIDPKEPLYYSNRGHAYYDLGDQEKALSDFNISIALAKENDNKNYAYSFNLVYYLNNRANYFKYIEDYDNAILDYSSCIELEPENANYYKNRANCYNSLKDFNNALFDFTRAIDLDPYNVYRYIDRADFQRKIEEFDFALKDYDKAISISNDIYSKSISINNRALIYEQIDSNYLALSEYTKLTVLHPLERLYWSNRGLRYKEIGDYEKAILDFTKAIELEVTESTPDYLSNSTVYSYRANSYFMNGNNNNALLDFNKIIDLDSTNCSWYILRAHFLKNQKKYDLALLDYNKIIELTSIKKNIFFLDTIVDYYSERAALYVLMKDYDSANNDIDIALKLDSNNVSAYLCRAKIFKVKKDYKKEKNEYLKIIKINNENPTPYYYLALLYLNQNKYFEAISYFSKAIERLKIDNDYNIVLSDDLQNIYSKETIQYNNTAAWLYSSIMSLSDLYLERAKIFKTVNSIELMCEDYKNSCNLGDCELFNSNCK